MVVALLTVTGTGYKYTRFAVSPIRLNSPYGLEKYT